MENTAILLIEDDVDLREMLGLMLEFHGLGVEGFATAGPALERLKEQDFAAVLTDHHLADADAVQIARRAGELRPGIPVVLFSGTDRMDELVRSHLFKAVVTKPSDAAELAKVLKQVISEARRQA